MEQVVEEEKVKVVYLQEGTETTKLLGKRIDEEALKIIKGNVDEEALQHEILDELLKDENVPAWKLILSRDFADVFADINRCRGRKGEEKKLQWMDIQALACSMLIS